MDEFMQTTKKAGHEDEIKRLSDNHEVFTDAMGALFMAPVDFSKPGLRILDSATADGRWLMDLQKSSFVQHSYVGTDIEPELFPSKLPEDFSLQKQSFTDPWPSDWNGTFDFVHQRLGLAGAAQFPISKVVGNFAGLCKPGGWVELVELDVKTQCPGNGPAVNDFLKLMREIFTAIGVGDDFALNLSKHLQGAGLEQVEQRRVECSFGAKAKSHLVQKSLNGVLGSIKPLAAVAETLPTISFSAEELNGLEARVREELQTQGGVYAMIVAYGRKP